MPVRVALLRGVNVGGAGKLALAAVRAMLADLGLSESKTCIQSGNAVFDSDLAAEVLEARIRDAVAARFGFAPECFVLDAERIAAALADHPFAGIDPKLVHLFFLKADPVPDEAALRALALPGDVWHVGPRRFTLHTPGGIGRCRLAQGLPRRLPAPMTAPMTARNLRTIAALQQLGSGRP
jgi:uncharacterized protein (DUF1697 family)